MKAIFGIPILLSAIAGVGIGVAQPSPPQASSATVPVSIVASVEARHGQAIPVIVREDVRAIVDKERAPVTEWIPLQGGDAGLQLLLLIDDGVGSEVGMQFGAIRQFLVEQPATTSVGIGYLHYGMIEIVQSFTTDHARAGKALRIPMDEGQTTSPFFAISDYIGHWPRGATRREIILISSGVDLESELSPMSVQEAVGQAIHAGVQIYTIYAGGLGHSSHSWRRLMSAQNNLAQLADETGGGSYGLMPEPPIAYEPFLHEINERLQHQYLLTFLAKEEYKGTFRRIHLETEVPNGDLITASQVYVPDGK